MKTAFLCFMALAVVFGAPAAALSQDSPTTSSQDSLDQGPDASPQMIRISPKPPLEPGPSQETPLAEPGTMVIDAPTAAALDPKNFALRSRFYSGGGLLQYVSLGVFRGLNIGASMSEDNLIGRGSPVGVRTPEAQVKYRAYDGNRYLPALAVGYDGQGYDYNRVTRSYNEPRRGFYAVASRELWLPGLEVHPSVNFADADSKAIFGALPLTYTIEDKVTFLAEWDNINNFVDSRVNLGMRIHATPHFDIDIAARSIGQGGDYADRTPRAAERVIQLRYTGEF